MDDPSGPSVVPRKCHVVSRQPAQRARARSSSLMEENSPVGQATRMLTNALAQTLLQVLIKSCEELIGGQPRMIGVN